MELKERLAETEKKIKQLAEVIQRLDQDRQNVLQELLRLEGEKRLLLELAEELK